MDSLQLFQPDMFMGFAAVAFSLQSAKNVATTFSGCVRLKEAGISHAEMLSYMLIVFSVLGSFWMRDIFTIFALAARSFSFKKQPKYVQSGHFEEFLCFCNCFFTF